MSTKILLVDDDSDIRKLFAKRLETSGFDVIQAANGEDALAQVEAQRPALIILDVMLPKLNGYEVCARIKKARATRNIPIIMFTASEPHRQIEGMEAGANSYISKLCPPQELLDRVQQLLASAPKDDHR